MILQRSPDWARWLGSTEDTLTCLRTCPLWAFRTRRRCSRTRQGWISDGISWHYLTDDGVVNWLLDNWILYRNMPSMKQWHEDIRNSKWAQNETIVAEREACSLKIINGMNQNKWKKSVLDTEAIEEDHWLQAKLMLRSAEISEQNQWINWSGKIHSAHQVNVDGNVHFFVTNTTAIGSAQIFLSRQNENIYHHHCQSPRVLKQHEFALQSVRRPPRVWW